MPLPVIKMKTLGVRVGLSNNWGFTLPSKLGLLGTIEELNLSDCSLVGPIPPGIGDLKELAKLDLSENKLSGRD